MEKIDLNKSLLKGRLIYTYKSTTILDIVSFAFILGFLFFLSFLILFDLNIVESKTALVLVILVSTGLSILKWNYTMRIVRISTNMTKKENRQLIETLIESKGFKYRYHNDNHIQCYGPIGFSEKGFNWFRMELNYIIKNKDIYFNICYWDSSLTIPSFRRTKMYVKELKNASAQSSRLPIGQ